jgi:hypothetical protein
MNITRKTLLASALVLGFAAPAFAAGGGLGELETDRFMFVGADGKMSYVTMNEKAKTLMMKDAKPVKTGTVFFRSGGILYSVEDHKLPDGRMLWQAMRDSDSNR